MVVVAALVQTRQIPFVRVRPQLLQPAEAQGEVELRLRPQRADALIEAEDERRA